MNDCNLSGNSTIKEKKLHEIYLLKQKSQILSPERKKEIVDSVVSYIPRLRKHREDHLNRINILRKKSRNFADKSVPAWSRVSTTDSESGYRLILAFRNNTCNYRRAEPLGLGCFMCGYYAGTGKAGGATHSQMIKQLNKGFSDGFSNGYKFDTVELLSDGSFLSDVEYNAETKKYIFELLASMPYIKKVLVESRPEYVGKQQDEIREQLKRLRKDQILEIGIGLETADDFIRCTCINKGFNFEVFESAVKELSAINKDCEDRCEVVAYTLIKPAFLTDSEAVIDVINTLRVLSKLSEKYNVRIIPKLEPVAISNGTILSLLYFNNQYSPLNYWAVLEIITNAHLDGKCKNVFENVRIGEREDMYDILKVPAIYKDGHYDQYDFILYDTIQQYNKDHDIFKVYAKIESTFPNGLSGLLAPDSSLVDWLKNSIGLNNSKIIEFAIRYSDKIRIAMNDRMTRLEAKFLRDIYSALDKIEGYDYDINSILEIKRIIDRKEYPFGEEAKNKIGKVIFNCFPPPKSILFSIRVVDVVKEPDGFLRVYFETRDFISGRKFTLWAEVPIHKY